MEKEETVLVSKSFIEKVVLACLIVGYITGVATILLIDKYGW